MGNQLARWFAVAVAEINAIEEMFFIPAYPFWGSGHHRRGRGRAVGAAPLTAAAKTWTPSQHRSPRTGPDWNGAHRRGVASEGMGSPSSYSARLVPPLRRSLMITAPAAARAAQDVR